MNEGVIRLGQSASISQRHGYPDQSRPQDKHQSKLDFLQIDPLACARASAVMNLVQPSIALTVSKRVGIYCCSSNYVARLGDFRDGRGIWKDESGIGRVRDGKVGSVDP